MLVTVVLFWITLKLSHTITAGIYLETTPNADFTNCYVDKTSIGKDQLGCALGCQADENCISASYHFSSSICRLTADHFVSQCTKIDSPGTVLITKVGTYDSFTAGVRRDNPVSSCKALKKFGRKTGIYWLDLDGGSYDNAFQAFCDMDTDAGGWTLVWSYTFTNYKQFTLKSNAVTPRPNWPITADSNLVPVSKQIPRTESELGALEFQQWKHIGTEFLMKSNINNWVACIPQVGSLVQWKPGKVTCRLLKQISSLCKHVVPKDLEIMSFGPRLKEVKNYYLYEGSIKTNWPTHDPCGRNEPNQEKGVVDPRGAIFLR